MTADRYITAADPRVRAICDEFGVKIIGAHLYPVPGETRAVATIRRIIDRCGEAHARLVLSTLTDREEKIIRLRFGIGEKAEYTLEEIGKRFNVSRERIRQIEKKALNRLRHSSRRDKLRFFLD